MDEWILVTLHDFADYVAEWWRGMGPKEFICFAPMLLFLELPRYCVPLFGLIVARWLKLPRVDHEARRALIARAPLVSVVVAGRNEAVSIRRCIQTLVDQDYPRFEILVVDDSSQDEMYELARPFARRKKIRLIRNRALRGRGGRPAATNLGLRLARGEFVVSLDADTIFDRSMIRSLVEHFADPRVGVVAGNILPRRMGKLIERVQCLEYLIGIDLYKRWTSLFGSTLQASGAIGAFRRRAVQDIGGWDSELAEDMDISLRMIKAGWRISFAHDAVSRTAVPDTMKVLGAQRKRWDKGGLRTTQKHFQLLSPRQAGFWVSYELAFERLLFYLGTVLFPVYLTWLWFQGAFLFATVLLVSYAAYVAMSILALIPLAVVSENAPPVRTLITAAVATPFYKEWLRWVRLRALIEDTLLLRTEDSYLPESAWANKSDL